MITVTRRHRWLLGYGAWSLLVLAGCGAKPDQVFRTWSSAVQGKNFPAIWGCLTPQTRGTVLQIMVLDADLLSAANPNAKQAFDGVYSKHGVNPQDAQSRLQVTNAADYAFELNNVLGQYHGELSKLEGSRYPKLNAIWSASALIALDRIQYQGSRATTSVKGSIPHTAANAQVQLVFEKVNGQWLISELEENSVAGAAMAGGPAGAGAAMPAGAAGAVAAVPGAAAATGPQAAMGAAMPPGAAAGDPRAMPGAAGAGAMLPNPGGPAMAGLPADPKNMPAAAGAGAGLPGGPNTKEGGLAIPIGEKAMPAGPNGPGAVGAGAKAMPANPPGVAAGGSEDGDEPPPARPGALGPGGMRLGKNRDGDAKAMPADPKNLPGNAGAAALPNAGDEDGPGPVGAAGPAGAGNGPGGGGNQNRPKQGTLEYAVVTFMEKVAEGDYSGMEYLIISRPKGLLKQIRDDEVSEEKKAELKAAFAEAAYVDRSAKNTGAARTLDMKGKLGHIIELSVGKEKGEFRIRDLKINEPGASKKR